MYGRRSSQRHQRDQPAVAPSSSRHPASSSRRGAQVNSSSSSRRTEATQGRDDTIELDSEDTRASSAADGAESDEDDEELSLRSYTKLNITETAKRTADLLGEAEIKKKAAEIARYALACEYTRTLIRKDDIRTKVLTADGSSKAFPAIFNVAQKLLHRTFGFNMVEVRAKGADNAELAKQTAEVLRAAKNAANGLRPRNQQREEEDAPAPNAEGAPTNTWVLVSALPRKVIKTLAKADQELASAYAESSTSNAASSSSSRRRQQADETKSALDWTSADKQGGEMGLLYVILAIILVNGRTITDSALHMYLRRLHLGPQTQLPKALRGTGPALGSVSAGSQSTQTQSRSRATQGTLEGFLNSMMKQAYLEKKQSDVGVDATDAAANQTQGRRRGRASGGGRRNGGADDDSIVWEWRWGSRAEVEVGEKRIGEFITHIFVDPADAQDAEGGEEEDEETQTIDRDRTIKRRKTLLGNISTAAGSQLIE